MGCQAAIGQQDVWLIFACAKHHDTVHVVYVPFLGHLVADALVAGGPGDSSSALTPKSRFGLATSSGSTFPAQSQRGAPTAAASFPSSSRPGRFLRHTEVVLHDPTGVLEQLWQCSSRQGGSSSSRDTGHAGTAKAKEAPGVASLPRVLEAHYPAKVLVPCSSVCHTVFAMLFNFYAWHTWTWRYGT